MPLGDGSVMDAQVKAVKKGAAGEPGELKGSVDLTRDMGSLQANTERGVFGIMESCDFVEDRTAVPVARRDQVHAGSAAILSNVSGDTVEEFAVEVVRVLESGGTQDLLLEITDQRLLEATGGIVQGMSGSPILQDGRIIGAVTHVMINNPERGYGILMENMLEAAKA